MRHEKRQAMDPERKRMLILYAFAASGFVGIAVALILMFTAGGSGSAGSPNAVTAAMKQAGCTLVTKKAQSSNQHLSQATQTVTYDTYPPVTGKHHPAAAIWGNYSQPVDPRQAVHNMEHGGVVIWYGTEVSTEERQRISDFYDESPNAMLVTPVEATAKHVKYPPHKPMGTKIALTAWSADLKNGKVGKSTEVVATCPRFDEAAFKAFRDEFRGKGPERFPVSGLTPGT